MKDWLKNQLDEVQKHLESIMKNSHGYCKSDDKRLANKAANINNKAHKSLILIEKFRSTLEHEIYLKDSKSKK